MKCVCLSHQKSGSLKRIQEVDNIQSELMEGEINHEFLKIGKYKDYENLF